MQSIHKFFEENGPGNSSYIYKNYFMYLQKVCKLNICYSINQILVVHSNTSPIELFGDIYEQKNNLLFFSNLDKFIIFDTKIKEKFDDEKSLAFEKYRSENNYKKILSTISVHENIAFKETLPKIIDDCINDGMDGIILPIGIIPIIKSTNGYAINYEGHAVIMYIDFRCNQIIIFNVNQIETFYSIRALFLTNEKFMKITRKLAVKTGGYTIENDLYNFGTGSVTNFYSEPSHCPRLPKPQTIQAFVNKELGGTCVLWSILLLKEWLMRKNPQCTDDYREFMKFQSFPDITIDQLKEIKKFYTENKEYFISVSKNAPAQFDILIKLLSNEVIRNKFIEFHKKEIEKIIIGKKLFKKINDFSIENNNYELICKMYNKIKNEINIFQDEKEIKPIIINLFLKHNTNNMLGLYQNYRLVNFINNLTKYKIL